MLVTNTVPLPTTSTPGCYWSALRAASDSPSTHGQEIGRNPPKLQQGPLHHTGPVLKRRGSQERSFFHSELYLLFP